MQLKLTTLYLSFTFMLLVTGLNANYRFTHLTIKDGLSQSTVKSISQDWRGFLWFGSGDGLNRFDGYNFTIYRNEPGNPGSLCGNDISCIYENPYDSTLWIGTWNDGFSLYNRYTDTFFSFRKSNSDKYILPTDNINAMVSVRRGELWIGTGGEGLIRLSLSDTTFTSPDFSKKDEFRNINTLLADNNGTLWIGTPTGLYNYIIPDGDDINGSTPEYIPIDISVTPSISSLEKDMRGNLWIGTSNTGLIRYHHESRNFSHFLNIPDDINSIGSNTVRSIVLRKNGSLWIGTDKGLYNFDQRINRFRSFLNDPSDAESISDDMIFSLYEDRSGVLWLGTYFGGINRVDPEESRFSRYTNFHKLFNLNKAANHVGSIYKDGQNRVWVSTSKGLIVLTNNFFKQPTEKENAKIIFRDTYQYFVFGDSYRNLYVSNSAGLFIKKEGNDQFGHLIPSNFELPQRAKFVSHAIEDSDRMVWFFTAAGLVKYNPRNNESEIYYPKNNAGASIGVAFLSGFESYNGKIWCGLADGSIYRFDRYVYQFERILPAKDNNENLPHNRVFSIYETEPGSLWFGTNNGLYHYRDKEGDLIRYMSSDGLSNNVVYSVLADNQNRIWCSTNLGISILDLTTNIFTNYSWEDGLQSNEFNQSAYFKSEDGLFYYGGIDGINIINPSAINPNPYIPPVVITGLTVSHERATAFSHPKIIRGNIIETQKITLKYDQAIFSFEFAALNYIHPGKNQYRYMLDGYDKEWVMEGNLRTAFYTNIPPGEYTFMVQGSNNSGIWNEIPTTVTVIILPPFWLTWWFKSLVALVLILIIYVFIFFRLKAAKSKNEWLQNQITEKTAALTENKLQIEKQNLELKRINNELKNTNLSIEEKNLKLNIQNEQIIKQRDDLIDLSNKLEQASQAKVNFFTRISQEFRTPLSLIMGPTKELLENCDKISKAELAKKFNIIHANAARLVTLINQLLDFRESETSRQQLKLSRIDIVRFIRDINFLFNDLASRRNIAFDFTSDFTTLQICIDAEKIEKVITNLISNAFTFSNEGGKINVDLSTIAKNDGVTMVVIKVSDTGQGIPHENLSLIFEELYDSAFPGFRSGLGIGLAMVKQYTELHGGNIACSSELGAGSVFTVTFPLVDDYLITENTKDLQKYSYSETVAASLSTFANKSIKDIQNGETHQFTKLVIIEDDPALREYLADVLSDRFRVYTADSYNSGLELIFAKLPDLIISGINLPDNSGYELCHHVKENTTINHIPVILLTSHSDSESQIMGLKSGSDAFIVKPFDMQLLIHHIDNLIALRKRIQSKYYFGLDAENKGTEVNSEEQIFLGRVIKEIEANMHNAEFDVDKLCKALGLSQPQTYRKIKAITDLSISELIRNTRLKKAARLLSASKLTVSEVAYQVGFSDPNYFSKCFTRLFGQTPTEYIKLRNEIG